MTNKDKPAATWSNVKAQLVDFDRAGLLGLVQDLYASSKDNRNFLHARQLCRPRHDIPPPDVWLGRWHQWMSTQHWPVVGQSFGLARPTTRHRPLGSADLIRRT
jgi:hypothetical protein